MKKRTIQNTSSDTNYQQFLLNEIFSFSQSTALQKNALSIYQNNLLMTALRSLSISYPVIESMVGEHALYVLTRRLLDMDKPASGDWAEWGDKLATCLFNSELYESYPYLPDIANLEWAFHIASRSEVLSFDGDSLQRLSKSDLEDIYCILSSSVSLLPSAYPQHQIWQAHRVVDSGQLPDKSVLKAIMSNIDKAEHCIAYQHNGVAKVEVLTEEKLNWMLGMQEGISVASLLDLYPTFNFASWLSEAISKSWLTRLD
ncbi:putative DNA-binding domain-containing protein [Alteromonas sediminis]|uniref:HvfC/BufC family peptide modification chaperone n=1 Tax=Alteromonas sediminis TaxID=2259342 RepID=UPI001404C330|nr:putative DNA-binding domain-containing protein [Alteromonas sediminis]